MDPPPPLNEKWGVGVYIPRTTFTITHIALAHGGIIGGITTTHVHQNIIKSIAYRLSSNPCTAFELSRMDHIKGISSPV